MKKNKEWDSIPLGKICLIRTGKKDANEGNPMGEFPFFTCSKINTFSDSYSFDTEAILIAGNGEVGNLHKYKGKFEAYQRTYVLDGFSLNINYIYQYVSAFLKNELKKSYIGSTIPFIKLSDLKNFLIFYPVLTDEQVKIAEILETLDLAIEQTETIITKQQRIKTGLLQDLLTKGIDKQGNIRTEETHEFKDSPLGRIPVEWEVSTIGECCNISNNLRKPISSIVRETKKGIYPYYGATGVLDYIDEYRIDGKYVLIGEDGDHFLKFKTQEMTILIDGKCNVNNHAHIISGKEHVLTEWIHLYFLHKDITFYLTRQGAGRFKLNKEALLSLPILIPQDKGEQDNILQVMNCVRQKNFIYSKMLEKLKLLKTALMQDLLTGKKRVTPLLKEIR